MQFNDPNRIEAPESDYLYLQESQIHGAGEGLFTAIKIYTGEIIALFKGEILSASEAEARKAMKQDAYFMVLPNGNILDCMHTAGFAKKANDASGFTKTNLKNNAKITLDDDGQVCLTATQTIQAGQEIYCSYGKKYWKNRKS